MFSTARAGMLRNADHIISPAPIISSVDRRAPPTPHMGMRGMLLAVIFALAAFGVGAVACSSGGSNGGGGGAGGRGGAGGATVFSCQDIRICALDYADDAAVM